MRSTDLWLRLFAALLFLFGAAFSPVPGHAAERSPSCPGAAGVSVAAPDGQSPAMVEDRGEAVGHGEAPCPSDSWQAPCAAPEALSPPRRCAACRHGRVPRQTLDGCAREAPERPPRLA
ncbi:hypothetical protein [Lichenibacterium dinghuense]|uniref:hypothetical protein n=1 Tax=Lichenibacterium dinghuense TaxID=2895977 RepID=UPI001F3272B7|nr:hypothetical protein [Lichenibacterium sp. 6Y81]